MKLIQCVNAYAAVISLMEREWDYETAYGLMILKRNLQPHADFFSKEEMKLVEKFAKKDGNGNIEWSRPGSFIFRDPKDSGEYMRSRNELGAIEVKEKFCPLNLPRPETIKPIYLEALEDFVEFEGGKLSESELKGEDREEKKNELGKRLKSEEGR